ncbi:hypothetical protein Lser_V15G33883 [Lactuca serriola]
MGHYKKDCPKARNVGGVGIVLTMGHEEAVNDPTMVTGTVLLNNSYACILFDSGAEKSFMSHKFKHLLKQNPQSLKDTFTIEMENGKAESTNDIYIGCTLTLNNYSFQIDLMLVTIKSFDVIIGMDWLSPHHANILCYKKSIHLNIPSNENLVIYGDKPVKNLQIISRVKAQKYLRKEYYTFLAYVVDKKQDVKAIKDIPKVCNFLDIFPEDLLGVPPERQAEFRTDLIPGATPVAKSPYRLALTEKQELSS